MDKTPDDVTLKSKEEVVEPPKDANIEKYEKDYNESSFWDKIKKFAAKLGVKPLYITFLLYYSLPKASIIDKTIIFTKRPVIFSLNIVIFNGICNKYGTEVTIISLQKLTLEIIRPTQIPQSLCLHICVFLDSRKPDLTLRPRNCGIGVVMTLGYLVADAEFGGVGIVEGVIYRRKAVDTGIVHLLRHRGGRHSNQ